MRERGGVEGLERVGSAIYSPAAANKTVQRSFMVKVESKNSDHKNIYYPIYL